MNTENLTLTIPVFDKTEAEKNFTVLIDGFLKPLDSFARRHRLGGMLVWWKDTYGGVKCPTVEIYRSVPEEPFMCEKEPMQGTIQCTVFGKEDRVYCYLWSNFRQNGQRGLEGHDYLPDRLFKSTVGIDIRWKTFIEYAWKFFESEAKLAYSDPSMNAEQRTLLLGKFERVASILT